MELLLTELIYFFLVKIKKWEMLRGLSFTFKKLKKKKKEEESENWLLVPSSKVAKQGVSH